MTSLIRALAVPLLVCALVACGKTNSDLIKENTSAFEDLRKKLKGIAGDLPAAGSVTEVASAKLDPKPESTKDGGNMAIVMAEQLEDPDKTLDFDLMLGSKILNPLAWTGPKNPMASSALGERGSGLEESFKKALDLRYLAIFRIVSFDKPVIADNAFSGGELKAEVFIVDLTSKKITPIGPVEAKPAENVSFTYKEGESQEAAAQRFIQSTVWTDARKAVKKVLEDGAGAKVTLD